MRENPNNPTAEYYIPSITEMIVNEKMNVRVILTNKFWSNLQRRQANGSRLHR